MNKIVIVLLCLAMGACATTRHDPNYQAYLDASTRMEEIKATAAGSRNLDYNEMLTKCTTNECVSSVASYKALADVVGQLSNVGSSSRLAAPQRAPTASEQLLQWASVLVPGITQWQSIRENGKTQRHISDNNTAEQISSNEMWSNVVGGVASQPSTVVNGNYGDTYEAGGSLLTGDGNNIGDRWNNSGRINSDGPIDNSGECRDSSCNPVEQTP